MWRFTEFGAPIHKRPERDLAFAVARFIQRGGSFVNYYMVSLLVQLIHFNHTQQYWSLLWWIKFLFLLLVTVSWRNKLWENVWRPFHYNQLWLWCSDRWIWWEISVCFTMKSRMTWKTPQLPSCWKFSLSIKGISSSFLSIKSLHDISKFWCWILQPYFSQICYWNVDKFCWKVYPFVLIPNTFIPNA